MKKNIYLIQASAVYGENIKSAYLPYAAGCLASYAFADKRIRDEYRLGRFIFMRENIDQALSTMEAPFLVGFSSYIWNMEYNKRFAKKLREKYPEVIIVFGGHNVKPDGSDLADIPAADIIIHGEGEEPFKQLLLSIAENGHLSDVPGISFRGKDGVVTNERPQLCDLSEYPSPYTEGYFDDIIKNSGISPSVIWETNRGCPNRCAFCDWGALKSKIRQFPMERLKAELDWMVRNRVEYVYCADANFGIFPRDTMIADMIIESRENFGYPQVFKTNYTKNKDDVVFEISSKLIKKRIGKSPTLSFQSLSPEVLKNIGRSNMELEHFKKLMARYGKAGVPVYSELILGLPGETYDSFSDGIDMLLSCNQHTCIGIYPCELLPNSVMGSKEYRERFSIKTVRTAFAQYHVLPSKDDVPEKSNTVIGTASMSVEDWKRSFVFSICVQAFHNLALTRAFAVWFHYERGKSYKAFYEALIHWMKNRGRNTIAGKVYAKLEELTDGVIDGENSFSYVYGEDEKLTWAFEEFIYIFLVKHAETFYEEIGEFLVSFGMDTDILPGLVSYQSAVLKKPDNPELLLECEYDFYGYFRNIYKDEYAPLEKKHNVIRVLDERVENWDEGARKWVWYGRRDDAQLYTGKRNTVSQTFFENE